MNVYNYLLYPWALLFILPIGVLIWILMKKEFVKLKEDEDVRKRRLLVQRIMLWSRILICLILLIAIATPYHQTENVIEGDPVVTVLIDNSTSMTLLESWDQSVLQQIRDRVEVSVQNVGSASISDIGDGVLNALGPYESVLLVSDGQVTKGADLGDVALWANRMNASINALRLQDKGNDVSVKVIGPSKTKVGVPTQLTVQLQRVGDVGAVPLKVMIDGSLVYDKMVSENFVTFNYTFGEGDHRIVASADINDYFAENNWYHKSVRSVPKPQVLFYTQKGETPILNLLRQVFEVETTGSFPSQQKLDDAYALVVNDVAAKPIDENIDVLTDYVAEGNGLLTIGGKNSYNEGKYRNSLFESLLPVQIAKAARKEGDINVVIVIDISGSTGAQIGDSDSALVVDVMKAMAIDVIRNSLRPDINLGIVAFNTQGYIISEMSYLYEKPDIANRIARLRNNGGTVIASGILRSIELLAGTSGSKNIILISDGRTQAPVSTREAAKLAANKGIKIFSVAVGKTTPVSLEYMRAYADMTNGIFYETQTASRLRILFGETEDEAGEDRPGLVVLNPNHFITEGMDVEASINGWNDVVPKTTAKLLLTNSLGDPVLTIWRMGLGRVAAWSSDDGSMWAGETLMTRNSEVWTRTLDWVIGEPDRKQKERVEIPDTRVDSPTRVLIMSEKTPRAEGLAVYKVDKGTYAASITPEETGFQEVLGALFAVNYPVELENVGMSQELEGAVAQSGGRMFSPHDVDGIVEFAKTRARRTVVQREPTRWPWITAAMIIFLLEIFIRRWLRKD